MQQNKPLPEQYLQILQIIKRQINRADFCELHKISQSTLSRILNGKIKADLTLLWYMGQHCGLNINFTVR